MISHVFPWDNTTVYFQHSIYLPNIQWGGRKKVKSNPDVTIKVERRRGIYAYVHMYIHIKNVDIYNVYLYCNIFHLHVLRNLYICFI